MKIKFNSIVIGIICLFTLGCVDVLDKENLTAIKASDVWNDFPLAEAYVNGFYADLMPGMPTGSGNYTDEASGLNYAGLFANPYGYGTAGINDYDDWQYGTIRSINLMLQQIESGSLSEAEKNQLNGQGYFWRAWAYFRMVKAYGGVPIITDVQGYENAEAIQLKRSPTSECIELIVKDLDTAFDMLPESWANANAGRIDKSVAISFKARVLLFYASPQFNPENINSRWANAYRAAKLAKEFCEGQGKKLYADFGGIWNEELNEEVIMVNRFNFPGSTYYIGCPRPLLYSFNCTGHDQPTLELVDKFPLVDGSPWDNSIMSHDTLHRHRSKRFYATIGYNGAAPYLKDMFEQNSNLWTYKTISKGAMDGPLPTSTSFYRVKAMDRDVNLDGVYSAGMDWPEIRFAEVLMTYGETANELDNTEEALQVLYKIRERAGILPGNNNRFGITANTKDEIRLAFENENLIEFALENKRFDQLRRLRKWDVVLNGLQKHGLKISQKEGAAGPSGLVDIDDYINNFNVEKVEVGTQAFNVRPEYYFFAIPKRHLDQNPNLEQTKGWPAGTFDPLL
jgi:hypothetical protein